MASAILEIAEIGGQRRVLLLSGPALPHAGTLSFKARQNLRTERYGVDVDQQVLGSEDLPCSPSGVWVDTMLAQGGPWVAWDAAGLYTGTDIASALDALRRGGEELRVTFDAFVRYGRIAEVEFTPLTGGKLQWSIDFEWTGREQLPEAQERIPTPESVPDLFTQAMEAALEGVDWFESLTAIAATTVQDVLDRFYRGPLAVFAAGGLALQNVSRLLDAAIGDSMQCATDYVRCFSGYADTVARMGGITGLIAAHCLDMDEAIEDLTAERFASTDEPVAQLAAGLEVGAARRLASYVAEAAAQGMWMAQRASTTHRADYRIHVALSGQTLLDVARKYYGDEERWTDLALHNGLQSPTLYAGQEVVIP